MIVEVFISLPWASLTFTGERHHVVVRLPSATGERAIDGDRLCLPRSIVAVEHVTWQQIGVNWQMAADLLTIDLPPGPAAT